MARSVIVSAVRTPFGRLGGGLKDYEATDLGAQAIKAGLVAGIVFLLFAFVGCESWSNRRLSITLDTVKEEQAAAERARGIAQQERDRAEGHRETPTTPLR